MKRTPIAVTVAVALAGLLALVWLRSGKPPEEEAKVDTEVTVRVGTVTRATLRAWVTAYGVVEPAPPGERPAADSRVAPPVAGVVAAVRCVEGQRVARGALLFQLDSRAADVVAERARKAVGFATASLERQKAMIRSEATSQKLVLEAEQALGAARDDLAAAETQQALLRVTAPLSGTVTRVNVRPGEAVDLATTLAEVEDLDRLVASAGVPIAELATLKAGQRVQVLADLAGAPVQGSLVYVGADADPKTGTATVRAALPSGSALRPGQFVTLRIVSSEHAGCLAVPVESVVKDDQGRTVVSVVQGDRAVQTPVKTGIREGALAEVEGLQEGTQVVTEGAYGLPKETRVRVLGK